MPPAPPSDPALPSPASSPTPIAAITRLRPWLRRLAAPAVTAVLLALLVRQLAASGAQIDPRAALARVSPAWLLAGVACFVAVNVIRAVRFQHLIPRPDVGATTFMPIGFALSFLNNILPFRGGEVVFVVAMRAGYGIPAADSTAALFLARMLDYLAVAAWFVPLAALSLHRLPPTTAWPVAGTPTAWLIGIAIAFMTALGALVAALAGLGPRALDLTRRALARAGLDRRPLARRAVDFADRTVLAFDALRSRRTYAVAFALTALLWLGIFAWQYSFIQGLNLAVDPASRGFADLGFPLFVVGATFGTLSKAVPVPTMGGHGVTEVGWTLGFTLVGVSVATAIAGSLGITLLTLFISTLFGLPALWWMERRRAARARLAR